MFYAASVSSPGGGRDRFCSMPGNAMKTRGIVFFRPAGTAKGSPPRKIEPHHCATTNGSYTVWFAALAPALVLGYLLLNTRVDIPRQEDCMLSRGRNCAAIELHTDR
jgi:hypothetical protein